MKSPFIIAGPQTGNDIIPPTALDKVHAEVPSIDINMVALSSGDADEFRILRESRYNSLQEKMQDFPGEYNAAGEQFLLPSVNIQQSQQPITVVTSKQLLPLLSTANPFSMLFNSKTKNTQTFTLDLDLNVPSKDLIKMLFEQNDSEEIKDHFVEYIKHLLDLPGIQEKLVESMLDYYNINLSKNNEEITEN
jgi:hypothetical protein